MSGMKGREKTRNERNTIARSLDEWDTEVKCRQIELAREIHFNLFMEINLFGLCVLFSAKICSIQL